LAGFEQNSRMPSHHVARLRFLALCIALALYSSAIAAIATLTLKVLQGNQYHLLQPGSLAAWLALSAGPVLLLTPLIGSLAGAGQARIRILGGIAGAECLLLWCAFEKDPPWLSVLSVLSIVSAFLLAAVLALIGSIARDALLRRATVSTLLACFATVGGFYGASLGIDTETIVDKDIPPAVSYACWTLLVSLLSAWFVRFDVAEQLPLSNGLIAPFIAAVRDSIRQRRSASALVGLWFWFFVAATVVVVLCRVLVPANSADAEQEVLKNTRKVGVACLAGILLSLLNRHPYRHGGFVFLAVLVATTCAVCLQVGGVREWPILGIAFALGVSISPLLHFFQTWTTPKYHGMAAAIVIAAWSSAAMVLAAFFVSMENSPGPAPILTVLIILLGLASILSLIAFFRPGMEAFLEVVLWPVYRIRAFGPGAVQLPSRGSHLLIANHSAWLDPLFMAKICAMPTTPMMTSKFYDLPVISWLMRNVIGTIRVPEIAYRSEAPELKEAVAGLDQGKCIVLFPEGFLRRKEEQPLRRFGRGVWQILVDRPETPVFACWIEGNWGSYLSFRNGPPTKNKRIDFWRHIRIGVIGPIRVDKAILGDHMAVRTFLMRQVAAAREPLGLPPLDLPTAAEGDKE
jgi:1-acyl-sn-glycerol-3-phosphate acyltransferase